MWNSSDERIGGVEPSDPGVYAHFRSRPQNDVLVSIINKRNVTIGAIIIGIPALLLAWWLFSPLFIDREVNEEFPMSAGAEVPDDMTQEEVEAVMLEASEEPNTLQEEPMPEMSQLREIVATGSFRDADDFHMGSGTATLYDLGPEGRFLRLEDFEVTNGPDLHVLLVPNSDPMSRDDVAGYVDLGSLKGNIGDQNYEIPPDLDLSQYGSVVIYCQPFHVLFSVAPLAPPTG